MSNNSARKKCQKDLQLKGFYASMQPMFSIKMTSNRIEELHGLFSRKYISQLKSYIIEIW